MVYVYLIVAGLVLGSFVNALVWRVHEQEKIRGKKKSTKADRQYFSKLSITRGRSMCLNCGHELAPKDLVPVVSWLQLRGKCRYCGAKFPDTPVAELLVPLLFAISYLFWPYTLNTIQSIVLFGIWLACVVAFVILTLYDLRWYILPDRVVFPLIGLALLFRVLLAVPDDGWQGVLLGGLWGVVVLAGLFYTLYIVSNETWIGGGDVKLAVALGLLAGGPLAALLLLFVASLSGTAASLPLLLRGRQARGLKVPFGPFLILATIVSVLFASPIIDWYTGLFMP